MLGVLNWPHLDRKCYRFLHYQHSSIGFWHNSPNYIVVNSVINKEIVKIPWK